MSARLLVDPEDALRRAQGVERRALRLFTPDPDLTMRQWSERHGRIADGSQDGIPFQTSLVPYLREPMDALSDPYVEEVSVVKCTQAGATVGLILLFVAYHVDQDPASILAVIPSVDEAEKWSKEKLAPAMECMPRVRGKLGEDRSRKSDSTILRKVFPGGSLSIVGSNSGRGFRMITVRAGLGDDVDAWSPSAGSAGDQITLIRRRTDRQIGRKMLWVSSPEQTRTGDSRIMKLYGQSRRRGRFHVPCPHCNHFQVLRRGDRDTPYGLKWEKGRPETAAYECEKCHALIAEREKWAMVQRGKYLTSEGEDVRVGKPGSVGYWFNAYTVVLSGSEWGRLAEQWIRTHRDSIERRSFINTIDADLFEEQNEDVSHSTLEARRETWKAEVPHGIGLLTMAVDVQDTWMEAAVWGWGPGEEAWLVWHERIWGDPQKDESKGRLEALRLRKWKHESGREVLIWGVGIDGRRLGPQLVYPYVRPLEPQAVYAMLGYDQRAKQILNRAVSPNKYGCRPWTIATVAFKDVMYIRLGLSAPGPGFIHFPQPFPGGGDAEFTAQFGAEVKEERRINGRLVQRYKQIRKRNESIDLYVIGLATLHTHGPAVVGSLEARAREWSEPPDPPATTTPAVPDEPTAGPPARRSNWVHSWKKGGR